MVKRLFFIIILLSDSLLKAMAYVPEDSIFVEKVLASGKTEPLWFARQFLGRPYVAHTLEINADEALIVNTREVDCTTFVENVLALTMCSRRGEKTFAGFKRQLTLLRYRHGILDNYSSRLHYFSDWINDNVYMGHVMEIQQPSTIFAGVQTVYVDWMSKHPESYRALREHPEFRPIIAEQEKALSGKKYYYIPTRLIFNNKAMREVVHNGDVIAIVSTKAGLDIAHLGFAVWKNGVLCFLDASSIHKKVVVEPVSLRQYLTKRKLVSGFRLVRLK